VSTPSLALKVLTLRSILGHGEEAGTAEADPLERLQDRRQLREVEAPDQAGAMEKAAAEFKVPANRLMAIRR
jgi:hypothetical protein